MAKETERKFLVRMIHSKIIKGILYRQGYLPSGSNITVRVRIIENKAYGNKRSKHWLVAVGV